MGTKTVRLDEDVYERIKAHKRPVETFSEAIDRLTESWSLLDLADTLDEAEAEAHREAIKQSEAAGKEATRDLLERQSHDQ
jgi:predicted CopG family antitoxin